MRRRTYLASLVSGMPAIAGCPESGGENSIDATTPTSNSTPLPTTQSPAIEIVDAGPSRTEYPDGDVIQFTIELRNAGSEGTIPLRIELDDTVVHEETIRVDRRRKVETIEVEQVPSGYHEYAIRAHDDIVSGNLSVGPPVEKPRVVTSHTVLRTEEENTPEVTRVNVDVEVKGDPDRGIAPPGRAKLLDICRKIILDELETRNWDVFGFNIWRESQTVGEEASHATITWGPDGNWSGAGAGADGDHSNYEFDVDGAEYVVTDGVDDIRTDKWDFRVEFDIVNRGVIQEEFSGGVATPETDAYEFDFAPAPGDRIPVWYEAVYDGPSQTTTYTIDGYGVDVLYGDTRGEIEFR